MFLQSLLAKNPAFVQASIDFHQRGMIPANSYVVDLDAVTANTAHLMNEARQQQLTVYAMSKQLGRAPGALDAITAGGVDGYVAVDMDCARVIVANGHNLGHLGHLVQVPQAQTAEAATMHPDYWTVFSATKADQVSAAAQRLDTTQALLVRVFDPADEFYPGHEGGITLAELPTMLDHIDRLPAVRFAGLTTFPALLFDRDSHQARGTSNVETLAKAAEIALRHPSTDQTIQINAPGTTSTAVLRQLREAGATQVEPGHGLTGTTPLHIVEDLPEQPAVLYLSEVAHVHQGTPFCFGGGLYVDPVFGPYDPTVVVAHTPDDATKPPIPVEIPDPAAIDYYAKISPESGRTINEGATTIFGFRIQAFVTRATITGLSGVQNGQPSVAGHWDNLGNRLTWPEGQ